MNNMGNKTSETEAGASKVGTYDIPDDRSQGPAAVAEPKRGMNWLWWLLALIILIALLAWAFNMFNPGAGPTNPAATATPVAAIISLLAL